jgi:hypothetical protein
MDARRHCTSFFVLNLPVVDREDAIHDRVVDSIRGLKLLMGVFVSVTRVNVFNANTGGPRRLPASAGWLLILAIVFFVSGFIARWPYIAQSELPKGYLAEMKGTRFYAVKHRGGENPPSFEISESQYRLWKRGETIHSLFHLGACGCFLSAWVIGLAKLKKPTSRQWVGF